jgi:adenine phosphoribosyltransferase
VEIAQIKALIRDVPDFPEPGIVFKDITPVLADPIAFSTIIDLIVVHFGRGNVDKVVGIEARGFILGAPVAYHFGAGVPVRKQASSRGDRSGSIAGVRHGHLEIHRDAVSRGAGPVVTTCATGGTASCRRPVERIGGKVRHRHADRAAS